MFIIFNQVKLSGEIFITTESRHYLTARETSKICRGKLLTHVYKGTLYHASSEFNPDGVMVGIAAWVLTGKFVDPVGRLVILKKKVRCM